MSKVLVIDDNPDVRKVFAESLTRDGHLVLEAPNGRVGIDMVVDHKPDLVVTDIVMPDVDGLELITGLRKTRPSLPIIAISGASNYSDIYLSAAALLGAKRILVKPFDLGRLNTLVDECLREGSRPDRPNSPVLGKAA